ncbi:hypothetical protein [Lelliottia amnigena]|uniref:hypothetical protein n=1 Tax=Lelliottia amnigena TaxID=61646 RepID=UPI001FD04EA4|nr:hypothetical protein [Lelliottia amnigena]
MSTITREFTKEQLTRIIESADDVITALAGTNEDCHQESDGMIRLWDYLNDVAAPPAIVKKLAEMALAGMEAEPVACIDQANLDYLKSGSDADVWPVSSSDADSVLLYSAPQPLTTSERAELENYRNAQQVVPGDITGPLAHAYKELTPHFMRNHISVFERYGIYPDGSAGIQAMRIALDVMERRAAMQSGAVKDGFVMVPKRLTAENFAKAALAGEFSETKFINCPDCFGDDECETCDGSGRIEIKMPVSWTNIKAIWEKGIEHFSAAPQQEAE